MDELSYFVTFLTSLGIGLLIGLERERSENTKAGLRTFALVAVAGTTIALLAERSGSPWLLAAGLLVLGAMMISAYRPPGGPADDPGTTTTAAVVVCYVLGAMLWYGYTRLAVALALTMTLLLYFKAELHDVTHRLSRQDLVSFFQFAVITVIVLPLLPDQGYGPYGALNPYRIWLMVVLIVGISLGGYATLRLAGPGRGVPLVGILGGMVSSTSTTLVYSRHAHALPSNVPAALFVILMANLIVLLRLSIITAVVAPSLLHHLLPVLAAGFAAGSVVVLSSLRRLAGAETAPSLEMQNPTELRAALGFAAFFALVLVASAWLHDQVGAQGIYALAAASGIADVDPISLSTLQMHLNGQLGLAETSYAIVFAYCSNLAFKFALVLFVGGRALAYRVGLGFLAVFAGLLIGLMLFV